MDRLDNGYEILDGWFARPRMAAAQGQTRAAISAAPSSDNVLTVDEALDAVGLDAAARPWFPDWLAVCGMSMFEGHVLVRNQPQGDRAVAVLAVLATPLTSDEIAEHLDPKPAVSSLRNALAVDDRVQRVDRYKWGLPAWGQPEYGGIRAAIATLLDEAGGEMAVAEVVQRIAGQFSVSPSSVLAYASSPPFQALGGVVRHATGPTEVRKQPEQTRRLFRREDSWVLRTQITKDHLRGSGFPVPIAIATITDLEYGDTCLIPSPIGEQVVVWTSTQVAFGTIRRLLDDRGIEEGAEVFLVLGDDDWFDIEVVPLLTGDPLHDAQVLAGQVPSSDETEVVRLLGRAVGLPPRALPASMADWFRDRGYNDIADLLDRAITRHTPDGPAASAGRRVLGG